MTTTPQPDAASERTAKIMRDVDALIAMLCPSRVLLGPEADLRFKIEQDIREIG